MDTNTNTGSGGLISDSTASRASTSSASNSLDSALLSFFNGGNSGVTSTGTGSQTGTRSVTSDPGAANNGGLLANTGGINVQTDPFIGALNAISARSDAATQQQIAGIQAQTQQQTADTKSSYENYQNGLQQLGVENGSALSTPDLLLAQQTASKNDLQNKITQLNSDEVSSISKANAARDQGDLSTMKDEMDYVQQNRNDRFQALQAYASHVDAERSYNLQAEMDTANFEATNGMSPAAFIANGGWGDLSGLTSSYINSAPGPGGKSINYVDISSPDFAKLPAGEQRAMLSQYGNVPIINSDTDQGKIFTSAAEALSQLQAGNHFSSTPLSVALGDVFGFKHGATAVTQLGLAKDPGITSRTTVGDLEQSLYQQMASASGMTVSALTNSTSNSKWLQATTGGGSSVGGDPVYFQGLGAVPAWATQSQQ